VNLHDKLRVQPAENGQLTAAKNETLGQQLGQLERLSLVTDSAFQN
jgi:hypothetical protein